MNNKDTNQEIKKKLLNRANGYYENNKDRLGQQAKYKYWELSKTEDKQR